MRILLLDIEFYTIPTHPDYCISRGGILLSLKSGSRWHLKQKKQWSNTDGYMMCKVDGKVLSLHRLLAQTFIPNPHNLATVNHKDGNKLNNKIENLEWVSIEDNLKHAMDMGLHDCPPTPIVGTSKDGSVMIFFDSQADVIKQGFQQPNVNKCLKGLRKHHKGFTWEYVD